MIKNLFLLLFFYSINGVYSQQLETPSLSYSPGFYSDSIFVVVSSNNTGVTFRYTLNGDEPTINSNVYSGPILIKNKQAITNSYSMIPTNPSFNYPINGYDTARADSRGWLPPLTEVNKASVLKVKAFKVGFIASETMVATYFIDPLLTTRYAFPILSISTDSVNFFSDTTGIYVYGIDTLSEGNYSKEGEERKVHLQFFETDGTLKISQYCGARNHGGGGRHAPQKALTLIARDSYGLDSFGIQLFADKTTKQFKSFLIRNGGHRPDCFPRDDFAGKVVNILDFEVQSTRYAIVFINGEYWGIQSIKDLFDEKYLANKYNVSKNDVAILELSGTVDDGLPSDNIPYLNMRDFAVNNDLNIASNYDYINTQMDVENYIDYMNSEIYFGNGDWPNNNIKFWRYRTNYNPNAGFNRDGRWRWMFYDLDAGFGGDCTGIYFNFNALNTATSTTGGNSTRLLRALLLSDEFRFLFINRMADLLNTVFLPTRMQVIANDINTTLSPSMPEHVDRWRYPSVSTTLAARNLEVPSLIKWNAINAGLVDFSFKRPEKLRNHFMSYFSLLDTVDVTINVSDTLAGRVKFSTLLIDKNTIGSNTLPYPWSGNYFTSIPIPLKAIPRPGYKFINWLNTSITNPDTVVYLNSDTSFTAVFDIDTSFHSVHYLYINEFQASNSSTIYDEYGERDDWIEIYNPNLFSVDIDNYYLTDTIGNKKKYRFSSGSKQTIIPPKGFLLVWADEQKNQGILHANFKLSSLGEELALVLPDGNTIVDSVTFSSQSNNHSWGRQHDADSVWIDFVIPTPRMSNHIITIIDESIPLQVYPNPSLNYSKLFFNKPVVIKIFNLFGQCILDNSTPIMELDVVNIPSGVYLIKSDKNEVVRWIKL
jgi:hypothetical protein